jgi:CubicO group peptidase (beta-lactamase class C family)
MGLRRLLLPAVAAAVVTPPHDARAQASAPPPWAAAVDSIVRAELARAKVPGAQIAVVEKGRLAYTKGYGVADVESGRAVTERTLFLTASVTKLVTAALLAQLAAEGTVDLQAPISRYVPELAGRRVGAATAHQLLVQSAGWADYTNAYGRTDDAALGDVFRTITDTLVLTEPGRVFSYSNPGFAMAGYVAERAAKAPFVELADRVVLRKLGMPRAAFRPMQAMTYDFSQGHGVGPGGAPAVLRPMPGNSAESPSGFLYASAAELARLATALMAGGMLDGERVLSADAVRAMTTGHIGRPERPLASAGYGMVVETVRGRPLWWKNGSLPGFFSQLSMWPDRQLAVVILMNGSDDRLLPATQLVAERVDGVASLLPAEPDVAERAPTAAERAELVGRYRVGPGARTIEVAEVNGGLEARLLRVTLPIRMAGADRMVASAPGERPRVFRVVRDADGHVRYLHIDARAFPKQPSAPQQPSR